MNDTVEDLLKPRYKVIADYPGQLFQIGDIIDGDRAYIAGVKDQWSLKESLADYPALFKPLFWWEDRNVEDLCKVKYVKWVKGFLGREPIVPVLESIMFGNEIRFKVPFQPNAISLDWFMPATFEEYNQYINKNK